MAWSSGAIEFIAPPGDQHDFSGDIVLKTEDALVLHGTVVESETGKPSPEFLVKLHARSKDGTQRLLGYALTNDDGYYLLHVDHNKITEDINALVIEASSTYHFVTS